MSTASAAEAITKAKPASREVRIYMRTWLLYWWPVWVIGYAMATWTVLDGGLMAVVPPESQTVGHVIVVPEGGEPQLTGVHVSANRLPGAIFAVTVLTVLAFSTGWLWGWRAYFFVATSAALLMFVSWMDWWVAVARWLTYLHVHINLGGYLVLATGLLLLWLVQFFIVDRRTFVAFTLSQMRVHYSIGEEERVYDTGGVSFEKAPYDWFRWLIGFGAGDLRIRLGNGQLIEIPNVVHLGRRLTAIEAMFRTRDVE